MSASTVSARVVVGEATARRLAERRDAMLANRTEVRERQARVREHELASRGVGGPRAQEIARLAAERDALVEHAMRAQVASVDAALARAVRHGEVAQAREAVARLEQGVDETWAKRTRQRLVLEEVAQRLPDGFEAVGHADEGASDNPPRLWIRPPVGHEMPVEPGEYHDGTDTLDLGFEVQRASIDRLETDDGTLVGCDAEDAVMDGLFQGMRDRDIDIERVAESGPAPARQPAEKRRHAER